MREVWDGLELARVRRMFKDTAGHEDLTESIIGCGMRVHETWGPGLLESVYKDCLLIEFEDAGHRVDTTRRLQLVYKGRDLKCQFCPDLIVDGIVVVELKAVEKVAPVHKAQLITYLKLTELPVGFFMNFNVPLLKYGTQRVVRPDLMMRRS
jgi:GxxExxY protein